MNAITRLELPQDLTGVCIERFELAGRFAHEDEAPIRTKNGRNDWEVRFVIPLQFARQRIVSLDVTPADRVDGDFSAPIRQALFEFRTLELVRTTSFNDGNINQTCLATVGCMRPLLCAGRTGTDVCAAGRWHQFRRGLACRCVDASPCHTRKL